MRSTLIATSILSAIAAVEAGPWQTLLRHQCGGTIELLPSTPAGIQLDFSPLLNLVDGAATQISSRTSCACPQLDVAKLDAGYIFINAFQPNSESWAAQCNNTLTQGLDSLNALDVNLPDTCTAERYLNGPGCMMQYQLPEYNMNLALAIKKCLPSRVPQFSVHCNGAGCDTFLKPCGSNSDCGGGQTCDLATQMDRSAISSVIASLLKQVGLCDEGGIGCFQSLNPNPNNDMLSNALTWVASNVFGSTSAVNQLSFCGVNILTSAPSVALNATTAIQVHSEFETITYSSSSFDPQPGESAAPTQTRDASILPTSVSAPAYNMELYSTRTISMSVNLTYLIPFSGTLESSNLNVLTAGLTIPPITVTGSGAQTGEYDILKVTCDKQVSFAEANFRARMSPLFDLMVTKIFQLLKLTQDCRAGVGPISEQDFLRRFGLWSVDFWMQIFDSSATPLSPVTPSFASSVGMVPPFQFQMPSTCNFLTWATTGRCTVTYNGLNSLAQLDLTLELDVSKCPGSIGQNSFKLSCVGADCPFFLEAPKICAQDSDCGQRAKCTDIVAAVSSIAQSGDGLDFISETCSSPVTWQRDIQIVMSKAFKQTPPTAGTVKYCTFDPNVMQPESMQQWAVAEASQMSATGGVMRLPSVEYSEPQSGSAASGLRPAAILSSVMALLGLLLA